MGIVQDIENRAEELEDIRRPYQKVWRDIVCYSMPMGDRSFEIKMNQIDKFTLGPESAERGKELFDHTSVVAVDRLTSGVEGLTTPSSEKWHGLDKLDPFSAEPSDEEQEWFDEYRDFLFRARYNPKAGFALANQGAIRSAVALGTGVFKVEESFDPESRNIPFKYRRIPLSENLLGVNEQGQVDTNYRRFTMTARQLMQRFGEANSDKVKDAANDHKRMDDRFDIIHAVGPREETGSRSGTNRTSPFSSIWIDCSHRHMIGDGGFFEFPYVVYYWQQDADTPYGQSPIMLALAEIKSLNLLAKNTLRAVQQWTNPPVGIADDGVVGMKVNLNPGKVNPGAVGPDGRLKVQPIVTAQNPTFIQQVMDVKRDQIRDALFVNLFQILVNNPQQTATEALIKANEKGELLGPAGSKIQDGLANMLDRETGILARKGAFESGSPLEPPESLRGEDFGARFTAPLDRLRRGNEAVAIQRTYETAGQIAAAKQDPTIFDKFDDDTAIEHIQQINGAPRDIFRTDEEVAEIRQQRADAQAQQAAIEQAQAAGEAANEAIPAIRDGADLVAEIQEAQGQ